MAKYTKVRLTVKPFGWLPAGIDEKENEDLALVDSDRFIGST